MGLFKRLGQAQAEHDAKQSDKLLAKGYETAAKLARKGAVKDAKWATPTLKGDFIWLNDTHVGRVFKAPGKTKRTKWTRADIKGIELESGALTGSLTLTIGSDEVELDGLSKYDLEILAEFLEGERDL